MFTLDDLLHPITPAQFFADYDDRKPLHIPAGDDARKREVLTWAAWNDMLNRTVNWTSSSLRLMRNHHAVPEDQYCLSTRTVNGTVMQPSPAKMEVFISAGASIVANDVQQMHAPLAGIADLLGRTFAAHVGANVYCSFMGVQAFGTHYDSHHVFVIHTEGEKVWNIYERRAESPVDGLADNADSRRYLEQSRGKVIQQVRMKPGDVLYLPRGVYHDALAEDGGSLHVTFSVAPLYGRILFQLLDQMAMQDPTFREYLPPAAQDGGKALAQKVTEMGALLARLTASPAFHDEVAMAQQRLTPRQADFTLPERKPVTLYQTTGRAFPPASTAVRSAYEWAMEERRFALEDMIAQIDFASEADLRAGVEAAVAAGALKKV